MYLIMPDRFANGDPSQRQSNQVAWAHRPTKSRYYHGGDLAGIRQVALPQVVRHHRTLAEPDLRQQRSAEREGDVRRSSDHGLSRLRCRRLLRRRRTSRGRRDVPPTRRRRPPAGIKVILDMVANHTGPYHPWVNDSPTPTWFHGTAAKHLANTWQTWTLADPHATPAMREGDARRVVHRYPPGLQSGRPRGRSLHHPEHAVVGRRERDRRHPSGHMAIRAASVLARLDDRDQTPVSDDERRRRSVRRRSVVRGVLSGRRDAAGTASTRVSTRCSTSPVLPTFDERSPRASRSARSHEMSAHDHLYPNASALVPFLGNHELAGS